MQPPRSLPRWLGRFSRVLALVLGAVAVLVLASLPSALADASGFRRAPACLGEAAGDAGAPSATSGCVATALATVVGRHRSSGRSPTYSLDLAVGAGTWPGETVSWSVYSSAPYGGAVMVHLWRGRLTDVIAGGTDARTPDNPVSEAQGRAVVAVLLLALASWLVWWPRPGYRRLRVTRRSGVPARARGAAGPEAAAAWASPLVVVGLAWAVALAVDTSPAWPAPILGALAASALLIAWLSSYAIEVSESGLTWRRPLRAPVSVSWDEVTGFRRFGTGRGAYWAIGTTRGRLRIHYRALMVGSPSAQPVFNEIAVRSAGHAGGHVATGPAWRPAPDGGLL